MSADHKIGIIAGSGKLPLHLIQQANKDNIESYVVCIKGFASEEIESLTPHTLRARLGSAGKAIDYFKKHGVKKLLFAGAIKRPSLFQVLPDWKSIKFLNQLRKYQKQSALGDDKLLSMIIEFFADQGFEVISSQDVLPNLILEKEGVLGKHAPDEQALSDIQYGYQVSQKVGDCDIGQSIIVQQGITLAVEAVEGTNALIKRTESLIKIGPKPILIKSCKPNQDQRVDMPTVGLETLERALKYGLRGLALQTGGVITIDLEEMIAFADQHNLFLYGIKPV